MVIEGISMQGAEREGEGKDIIKGSHYLVIDSISSSTSILYTNKSNCSKSNTKKNLKKVEHVI